jgi:hypothetical protein
MRLNDVTADQVIIEIIFHNGAAQKHLDWNVRLGCDNNQFRPVGFSVRST